MLHYFSYLCEKLLHTAPSYPHSWVFRREGMSISKRWRFHHKILHVFARPSPLPSPQLIATAWSQDLYFGGFFKPFNLLHRHQERTFRGKLDVAGLPKIAVKGARNHSFQFTTSQPWFAQTPNNAALGTPVPTSPGCYVLLVYKTLPSAHRSRSTSSWPQPETPRAARSQPVLRSHTLPWHEQPFLYAPLVSSHNKLIPRKCYCFMHRLQGFW